MARVPTDVWRLVIQILKATTIVQDTALKKDSEQKTEESSSLSNCDVNWSSVLRAREWILALTQTCRAVFFNTRALFMNNLEKYLSLVKGCFPFSFFFYCFILYLNFRLLLF
jgi:hypothetical protein